MLLLALSFHGVFEVTLSKLFNIIATDLVKQMELEIDASEKAEITAFNGSISKCYGAVNLEIEFQDSVIFTTAYVTPDISKEVYLGWKQLEDLKMIPTGFPYTRCNINPADVLEPIMAQPDPSLKSNPNFNQVIAASTAGKDSEKMDTEKREERKEMEKMDKSSFDIKDPPDLSQGDQVKVQDRHSNSKGYPQLNNSDYSDSEKDNTCRHPKPKYSKIKSMVKFDEHQT